MELSLEVMERVVSQLTKTKKDTTMAKDKISALHMILCLPALLNPGVSSLSRELSL
jgi:hypothetical protein